MTTPIELDGAMGEGGEQILRSALGLSLLSGRPFQLSCIRADRDRAGLRPQHLAAVHAAAAISAARVTADRIGSEAITFEPGPVRAGDYFFDIGAAGATSLVFQTLLLPLARAAGSSRLTLRGGTHVPASPCYHYLDWHWRSLLAAIGVPFDLTLRMAVLPEMRRRGAGGYPRQFDAARPGAGGARYPASGSRPPCGRQPAPRDRRAAARPDPAPSARAAAGPRARDCAGGAPRRRTRDLEKDLHHLFRSLRQTPLAPVIVPARCRSCGFRFDDHKLHKPGKCPHYKGTWISEPRISLEEKR